MSQKQAIAGVAPSTINEVTIMTVWPTLAAMPGGRFLGQLYEISAGITLLGIPITVGRILALLSIPFVLPPYFIMLIPRALVFWGPINPFCYHYRLTNRRVCVMDGLGVEVLRFVSLDRFDSIEVQVFPGQQWFPCGDLVFKQGAVETFRINDVPRPETFKQTCFKAHQSFVGVAQARQLGVAV